MRFSPHMAGSSFDCSTCSVYTESCSGSTGCVCFSLFLGATCNASHIYLEMPVAFHVSMWMNVGLHSVGSLFGVVLITLYLVKIRDGQLLKAWTQIPGILFITAASLSYLFYAIAMVSVGPSIEILTFADPTSFVHLVAVACFAFFYPLALTSFAIQVSSWVELSLQIKMISPDKYNSPSVRIVSITALVGMYVLCIAMIITLMRIGSSYILRTAFSAYLGICLLALLLFSSVFGRRIIRAVESLRSSAIVVDSTTSMADLSARLTVLMLLSSSLFLAGAIVAFFSLFPQYYQLPAWHYGVVFPALVIQSSAVFSIEATFLWNILSMYKFKRALAERNGEISTHRKRSLS